MWSKRELTEGKTKGRKRHIVVDVLGCLLSVVVHAANIHDIKGGISTARRAYERYPSIQKFCADAGYQGTFVSELKEQLALDVDIFRENQTTYHWRKGNTWRQCPGYPAVYQRCILDSAHWSILVGFTRNLWKLEDGMPVRFFITSGTTADCTVAAQLIEGFQAEYLLADRGYDTDAIILKAVDEGMTPVIPPRKNRKHPREYDEYLYKLRHLIENAFLLLKRWRGIATHYAKNAASFAATVQIRCIAFWLLVY